MWGTLIESVLINRKVFRDKIRLESWFLLVKVTEVIVEVFHKVGRVIIRKAVVEIEVVVIK